MKRCITKLLIQLTLLLLPLITYSQVFPIQIQALVQHPIPTHLSQLVEQNGQPLLILINTSLKQKSVMLSASLTSDNGIYAYFDSKKKKPSYPIIIPAFGSVTITGDDLINIFSNYTVLDINYKGIKPENLAKNQLFPEGTYVVCVTAYDYNSKLQLSSNPPSGCTEPIIIKTPEPPHITYPLNNSNIQISLTNYINFNWTSVTSSSTFFQYNIRISKVPAGINPYDAIENENFLWWQENGLSYNHYLYDNSKPNLIENTTYAVQITAYDPLGDAFIKNEGKSEIHLFTITNPPLNSIALLIPEDNSSLLLNKTSPPIDVRWEQTYSLFQDISYELQIAKLSPKNTKNDAFDNIENIIYTEKNILETNTIVDKSYFENNQSYAFRVRPYYTENKKKNKITNWSNRNLITFEENLINPPTITYPKNNEVIAKGNPFNFDITWDFDLDKDLNPPQYQVEIWEITNKSSVENWISKYEPFLQELTKEKKYLFDIEQNDLNEKYKYALRVTAITDKYKIENNGESELIEFEVTDENESIVPTLPVFDCNNGCEARAVQNQISSTIAKNGDVVRIGNFLLDLDQVDWNNGLLSGIGRIRPTELMPIHLRVEFQDLRINILNEVYEGTVSAAVNQDFLQVDWINEDAWVPPTWNGTADQFLDDVNTFVENLPDVIDPQYTTGLSLPLGIYGEKMSSIITRIDFTPNNALYNLISYVNLPGDVEGTNKLLMFGAENICFTPKSLSSASDETRLQLINEIEFHPTDKYHLRFFGNNSPDGSTSSFATFDCNGFVDMTLDGLVIFDRDVIIPRSEDGGTKVVGGNLGAFFNTTVTSFSDIVIQLNISQDGSVPNGIVVTDYFEFVSAPDYTFKIKNLILDNSITTNAPDMTFPPSYNSGDNNWQGLYFKDLEVQLPYW